MLDCFDLKHYQMFDLKSIHLNFKLELNFGQKIVAKLFRLDDHQYEHKLFLGDSLVAAARSVWIDKVV